MRSFGSTRSPRGKPPIRRFLRVIGNDHPKACTGRRLLQRGLAEAVMGSTVPAEPPVVLDPYAPEPLSRADVATAERGGVLAVDCSWNQLSEVGRLPGGDEPRRGVRRRLPFLVATNPQHYGRLGELNTVEALGAALYVLGRPEEAAGILEGFAGGPAFLEVNRERLDRFAAATDAEATRRAERGMYGGTEHSTRSSGPTAQSPASRPPRP
jgi:pre-rRNA-processing protein TSR3